MKSKEKVSIKAYKVFNPDWTCKDFQYKVGKTYKISEEPVMCEKGFHACRNVSDCFSYYPFNPKNKVAEVLLSGIVLGLDELQDKQCAQKITILREISWADMLTLANTGLGNSGHSNSGDRNSGDRNSGHRNSGDRNSGHSNSGYSNSRNRNSGDRNSGHSNSGDRNSGHSNSGDSNSGHSNSGHSNSGHSNSGDSNSGHSNSGDSNSGNRNSGSFNSTTPVSANFFNKPCLFSVWDNVKKPNFIYNVNPCSWVSWSAMTDDEKRANENAFVTEGYLKNISYKEAWAEAYKEATEEDIKLLKALPNWDADVFEEITGIHVE
jgi:hypothetical protein